MTRVDPAIQAQVDAQLLEQGAYTTLDLLINTGRLIYGDYESWRRGEIELLDGVLMGAPQKIRTQIEQAAEYARGIGLVEQAQEFQRWRAVRPAGDAKPLRTSADPQLHSLLAARFAPMQSTPQMDLFFDNPVVAMTNGVVRALCARNLTEAQRQLDQLYAQAPTHADLAAFDRLTAALERLHQPVTDVREWLAFLLDATPGARRLLGSQARDLLTPLWRQLADALIGRAYSDDEPDLHRSFALSHAQDWAGVSEAVLSETRWPQYASLCLRLAHSSLHRQQRIQALIAWYHLCWLHPAQAAHELNSRQQPDAGIARAWARFLESEDDADAAEEDQAPGPNDFPAWMLLQEPGLAQHLPFDLPIGSTPGEEHYRQVHRWIHARRTNHHEHELTLRKTLQTSSPFLFRCLKLTVQPAAIRRD